MDMKGSRELGLLIALLVVASRAVDGPALWLVSGLAVATAVAATLHILGEWRAWRVSVALALPALGAFGAVGGAHLLPSPWLLAVAPATAVGVAWLVDLEVARSQPAGASEPTGQSELSVYVASLILGFVGFGAIGGLVPAALGADQLTSTLFVATVALDVAVGGVVGYRLVALSGLSDRSVIFAVGQFAGLSCVLGALVRALDVRGLIGPALLIAAIYVLVEARSALAARAAGAAKPVAKPAGASDVTPQDAGIDLVSPVPAASAGPEAQP